MREPIVAALEKLASEHQVRVLYAVESGSRAWGFASPDSDYDVRFLYVHRPEWYLRVKESRDVIEAMLPNDLDFAGWELRKALRLFARGNTPLYEWLGSPNVYAEAPGFANELRAALPEVFNPAPVLHQYLGQAARILEEDLRPEEVRLKRIFYFLRPLFAARWVAERLTMAPTVFRELVEAPWVRAEDREWVEVLLAAKREARERDLVALAPERKTWMWQELERLQALVPTVARPGELPMEVLDGLLWCWVMGEGGSAEEIASGGAAKLAASAAGENR